MSQTALQITMEAINSADAGANETWKEAALKTVELLARSREIVTSDAVVTAMENLPVRTHEPRALGPIMLRARKMGLIEKTNEFIPTERDTAHGSPMRVWKSKVYRKIDE